MPYRVARTLFSFAGVVEPGLYRAGYPKPDTFPFLAKLQLRTVINLLDKLPEDYEAFLREHEIRYVHLPVKGNKVHCEEMDRDRVALALSIIMDAQHHPVLVHCRSGKHRTGALIGCVRMLQRWSLEKACDEYVAYCKHKQREVDKQYVERFDPRTMTDRAPPAQRLAPWLPPDCCVHPSALAIAIARGDLQPSEAVIGLRVRTSLPAPPEPGLPEAADTQDGGAPVYRPFARALDAVTSPATPQSATFLPVSPPVRPFVPPCRDPNEYAAAVVEARRYGIPASLRASPACTPEFAEKIRVAAGICSTAAPGIKAGATAVGEGGATATTQHFAESCTIRGVLDFDATEILSNSVQHLALQPSRSFAAAATAASVVVAADGGAYGDALASASDMRDGQGRRPRTIPSILHPEMLFRPPGVTALGTVVAASGKGDVAPQPAASAGPPVAADIQSGVTMLEDLAARGSPITIPGNCAGHSSVQGLAADT